MEVTKTIKAKVVELTTVKRELLEAEYSNYQKALRLSKELIRDLKITSLKQAGKLLYDKNNRSGLAFECIECDYKANSDLIGAINVARRSLGSCELYAQKNGRHESVRKVDVTAKQSQTLVTNDEVALTMPQAIMSE